MRMQVECKGITKQRGYMAVNICGNTYMCRHHNSPNGPDRTSPYGPTVLPRLKSTFMLIVKQSDLTGRVTEMDIPISIQQYEEWQYGMDIDRAMPGLSSEQRLFIEKGITPEEAEENGYETE